MKDGFRQSMSWLHTWCGLACGWLLCAIFLAGSLSVFRDPITRWMVAEPVLPVLSSSNEKGAVSAPVLAEARRFLAAQAPDARFWRIELPDRAGSALRLFWSGAGPGRSIQEAAMDPRNGQILPAPWGRRSEGGRHFMTLHYTLHAGMFGFWLVGALSMGMLVALISGVVVHKRIFKDFFTFRPRRGQRSWLDAHNATAVLTLPFQLMIVYTGLAIFYTSYMPGPLQAAYGSDGKEHARWQADFGKDGAQAAVIAVGGQGASPPAAGMLARPELSALRDSAVPMIGGPIAKMVIERPGSDKEVVRMIGAVADTGASRAIRNVAGQVAFNGVTGDVVSRLAANTHATSAAKGTHDVLEHLHLATFGGWALKWVYFVSGLAGTTMMATGVLLFTIKRRQKSDRAFGGATARVYRVFEAINVAAIAGAALACIAYLYGNRLIPADLPGRDAWEIRSFFAVWLLSLIHALLRQRERAWVEQLGAAAVLCLLLPILNVATTGQHLLAYLAVGDGVLAGVELTVLGFGMALAVAACQAWRRAPEAKPARSAKLAAAPVGVTQYRWQVASRVLAAVVAGYALAAIAAIALAGLLPAIGVASVASSVAIATLLSFIVYAVAMIWAFSVAAVRTVWIGLLGMSALLGALAVVLGGVA